MADTRIILHVDMDAFFASVEQLDNPSLRGKPVLVGYDGPRGVVAAASYEARRFGCHSAQPIAVAKRNCPQAIIVRGNGKRYRQVSEQVFSIFHDVTDLVEPLSIDEAYLDVTGSLRRFGSAMDIAQHLKQRIKHETQLTASVGIAPNKFLAKLASDLQKPDGLVKIGSSQEEIDRVLLPLPITRIWGLGPAAAKKFDALGVHTIADLRQLPLERLCKHFGSSGEHFYHLARGYDQRKVTPDREAKSIGEENTYGSDVENPQQVRDSLRSHVEAVARRLRKQQLKARRVTVKIRYGDFETITRSVTLDHPTDITQQLWQQAVNLYDRWANNAFRPVRLIGMTASDLSAEEGQLNLFSDRDNEKLRRLDAITDTITDKFGKGSIRRGS